VLLGVAASAAGGVAWFLLREAAAGAPLQQAAITGFSVKLARAPL
jgi:hypothetical protein